MVEALSVGSRCTSMSEAVERVKGGVKPYCIPHDREGSDQLEDCDCDKVVVLEKGEERLIRTGSR